MWVPKGVMMLLDQRLGDAAQGAHDREVEIGALNVQILQLRTQMDALRERLIKAEGDARSHQAYADVWRLQVNTLTETNAALLTQLLPTLTVKVPTVERAGVALPSGLDFEDMGDAAASIMGLADEFPADPSHDAPAPPLGDIPAGRIVPGTPRVPAPVVGLTDRNE